MRWSLLLCLALSVSACASRPVSDPESPPEVVTQAPESKSALESVVEPPSPIRPPREAKEPPPAPVESELRELHGYSLRAETEHFRLYGAFDANWTRLAEICDTTRARLRDWLDAPPTHEPDPVDLFLVREREEIRALEDAIGMMGRRNAVRRRSGGGYYHRHRTILLQLAPGKNLEWLVSHEACHSVFRKLTHHLPAAMNEGLAELIPAWILFAESEPGPETVVYEYRAYADVCARLVREERVPELRTFFQQSFDRFQSDRWTNFALAWSLFRMLMTSREEGVTGKLPLLMAELEDDSPAWGDFARVYDVRVVEELWTSELREAERRR